MPEADGSNDKRASFSAILKLVGGPLLSQADAIPDELSAILTLGLLQSCPSYEDNPILRRSMRIQHYVHEMIPEIILADGQEE
jgi:hypothetical protein